MKTAHLIGLSILLLVGCDAETEEDLSTSTEPAQAEDENLEDENLYETDDPVEEEEVLACEAEDDDPVTTLFLCLDGLTCPACDSALPLVIEATLPCVIDADITYDEPPGMLIEMYAGMVETDDIIDIIEIDRSPYSVSCIEDR